MMGLHVNEHGWTDEMAAALHRALYEQPAFPLPLDHELLDRGLSARIDDRSHPGAWFCRITDLQAHRLSPKAAGSVYFKLPV